MTLRGKDGWHVRLPIVVALGVAGCDSGARDAAGPSAADAGPIVVTGSADAGDAGTAPDAGLTVETEDDPRAERSRVAFTSRPRGLSSVCSPRGSACVHVAKGTPPATTESTLAAVERALATLEVLRLARPRRDGSRGGSGALDVYVDADATETRVFVDEANVALGFDEASAFVVTPLHAETCVGSQRMAGAVARAGLIGLDAATHPDVLAMIGDYLALFAAPCSIAEIEAVDTAQRAPERTFLRTTENDPMAGAFMFPWYLEDRYGTGDPGVLATSLVAISGQRTKPGAPLVDEPDVFDALRVTQRTRDSSLADILLDFAVHRAFVGSRSDEAHMIDAARFGDLGRVRMEWSVDHASLPRRLAPSRAVEPLGAAYGWLDLTNSGPGAELTFVAEWEVPVAFRWALVKVDASGSEMGRLDVVPVFGEQRIEKTVRELAGLSGILIVGMNEGEASRDEPFDPGARRSPPHSFTMTLYP